MAELNKLVMVKLDKERHLKLSMEGMLAFEQITGLSWRKGFKLEDLGLKELASMLWACLIHEDEELTYKDVVYMMAPSDVEPVMTALADCLLQAFPKPKAGGRPLVKTPRPG